MFKKVFQSTRSERSATAVIDDVFAVPLYISIHALRAERDFNNHAIYVIA